MDQEQIKLVGKLAKLEITDENIQTINDDLNNILALVDQMQSINTDGVEPLSHPMDAVQRLRNDTVTESNEREKLQRNAPATENGLFLVPKVIENDD